MTQSGYTAYINVPGYEDGLAGPDPAEVRFQTAFAKVKIGMTLKEVQRIGPPLRYFSDKHTVETAAGTTTTYSRGRQEIVFRNGVVVLISR